MFSFTTSWCGTMFSEQIQTRACPRLAGPPPANPANNNNSRETPVQAQRLPAFCRQAWAGEQEKSAHSHPRLPEQEKDCAHAGYCVLLAAHLHFFAANHWRRGNKLQGNKNQSKLFQLESWSYLGKHQTYAERVSFCPALSYVQVRAMNFGYRRSTKDPSV